MLGTLEVVRTAYCTLQIVKFTLFGGYWRHFYSDSEATAQCELFLTAPNDYCDFLLQLMLALSSLVRNVLFQGSLERSDIAALFPGVFASLHTLSAYSDR